MRKAILTAVVIMAMATPAMADQCTLLGDFAVQFTQYRDQGKPLSATLAYVDKNLRSNPVHKQIARAIYSGTLNPRQNRTVIENMCRDQRGH